jgi:predicted transcriptional regulator
MNAYKFYGKCGLIVTMSIQRKLGIKSEDIFKEIQEINGEIIVTKNGKKYSLELTEIT